MAASVWLGRCPHHASAYDYYGIISSCLPIFVLAQFALGFWYIISVILVSGSPCSGCLGVAYQYEYWIPREMTFFVGAMLGTTVDTCSASVLW